MSIRFDEVMLSEIEADVRRHLDVLPSKIDSFLEAHIRASHHYAISIDNEPAGFASIHTEHRITQFVLSPAFQRHGQAAFSELRGLERVDSAFVSTCDEFYLAHALDDFRTLDKQAYFFATGDEAHLTSADAGFTLRPARLEDANAIHAETGDFFDDLETSLRHGEISITERAGVVVGFGITERSTLYPWVASIGMITIERYRGTGVGTATIRLLIDANRRAGIEPIAGCWYGNTVSKRTLERAGMHATSRLFRVEF